ncbi:MAG TPA: hypothetical protein VLL48_06175, partial [Longimicrobiales bacterium]|nr:hypothetical protein [Longimicrobiales bacterium]
SPGFDFLEGTSRERILDRFHGGWEAAIEAGAILEHRIVPGARFLIWEDVPDAMDAALLDLSARRGR